MGEIKEMYVEEKGTQGQFCFEVIVHSKFVKCGF